MEQGSLYETDYELVVWGRENKKCYGGFGFKIEKIAIELIFVSFVFTKLSIQGACLFYTFRKKTFFLEVKVFFYLIGYWYSHN